MPQTHPIRESQSLANGQKKNRPPSHGVMYLPNYFPPGFWERVVKEPEHLTLEVHQCFPKISKKQLSKNKQKAECSFLAISNSLVKQKHILSSGLGQVSLLLLHHQLVGFSSNDNGAMRYTQRFQVTFPSLLVTATSESRSKGCPLAHHSFIKNSSI